MKIHSKIMAFLIFMVADVAIVFLILISTNVGRIRDQQEQITGEITASITDNIDQQLRELAENVSQYVLIAETEMDKSMLNAAMVLYEVDRLKAGAVTQAELEQMKSETGMSDLYLGNRQGVFTLSTEPASIGLSLFDIWDGYRMLVTGESDYLPSLLKIKVETGEIFKFTAIPRANNRGVIESALAADTIEEYLQRFLNNNPHIKSLNIFDPWGLVLTENIGDGQTSIYKKQAVISDPEVFALFGDPEKIQITINDDDARIFYPVLENGSSRYVLFMDINTDRYFSTLELVRSPLEALINRTRSENIVSFFFVFGSLVVLSVIISFLVRRTLRPLGDFNVILAAMAKGDFTVRPTEKDLARKDETGEMSRSFLNTVEQVGGIVGSIKTRMTKLEEIGDSLAANAEETQSQVMNIGNHIKNVTGKTTNQTMSVSNVSSSVEEITRNIESLDSLIDNQSAVVSQSSIGIEEMLQSITAANTTLGKIASEFTELVDASRTGAEKQEQVKNQVQNIVSFSETLNETNNVIARIASQTNLLAMNAAIEAAHAGESGKGFAVVADEIRKLAEESSKQSKTVGEQLKMIQNGIGSIVISSGDSKKAFDSIVTQINDVNKLVTIISADVTSQNTKSQQIKQDLDTITNVTSQVQNGAFEMRKGSESIVEEMVLLRDISKEVHNSITEVTTSVSEINKASEDVLNVAIETKEKINDISDNLNKLKI
ncbi:methyl-accepting chemotaxis protein [Brucepastera parasyntrophica]|uniref:methyl-accepting chemotaxis protein n=1 Tax=Brucepastera parasyntrophica TaxID=2880008 RepID=UPI00210EA518|nr:methyl-accepting chemotaxis protein [Brucepastera parasyntrophica]ULQ58751.1 methyl-accepting chemotaxis protein [Brucepastera parasyntrophica]